jgi:SAM-dependent methyltransferase
VAEPKETIVGVFGRAARTYGEVEPRIFGHFGRRLVELAALPPDAEVLDVATGKGAVLLPAAERAARVVGIDLAEPMARAAARIARERGLDSVEVHVMDAERLELADASFDAVLCGFAIFFFPEPERALEEFRRVLRPGGLVGLSIFGEGDERWSWIHDLMRACAPDLPPPPSERFPGREALADALREAGFESLRFEKESLEGSWADDDEWFRWSWSHGQRRFLERLDDDRLARFRADAFAQLERAREADGRIHARFDALFGYGVKP